MSLEITRDSDGKVTIVNPATGKSEVLATGVAGRPMRKEVAEGEALPSHQWSRLA